MRAILGFSVPVIVLGLVVASCTQAPAPAPPKADMTAITAQVDSMNKAFVAAVAARDTDAMLNFYADDAHILPPNAPRADGREAVRQVWAEMFRLPGLSLDAHSTQLVTSEAGDLVIDVGAYTMKMQGPKGKEMEDVGKYVTAMKKTDGGWKIVVDTFNSDKPMAAGH